MSELRALLLTDVVDSTKLSEQLGDAAMAEVWAAHDRLARDLLPTWRGREIDKTDGMLLLFELADDAVGYALAYHRALATLPVPLRARAGLHVGPVILRENLPADVARGAKPLEVDGLAKPTAARVMSLARGGQTLITPEARAALNGTTLATQSHGHWVMKGVAEPIELFEAGDDPAHFAPPPDGEKVYRVVRVDDRWVPVREVPNNLPEQFTRFVGRERELDEIKAQLTDVRMLTLLGMGGLGKTRLSLQVALELRGEFPDGVWFLDLAPLRDGNLVLAEAAQVLGLREEPGLSLLQAVCSHLRSRRVLIVLDNCEHLLKPVAQLAHAILRAAPKVSCIASSREALRLPGERCYPILPLPLPGRHDDLSALARSTAVRLFVERAQEHQNDFALTEDVAPAVAELVTRLEGIPLALELAAARVRSMTVADINRRLDDRYQVLTEGSIFVEERQQTLRALVDWSYDLLNGDEQRVLIRLAEFAGGFDLAAAEAVCGEVTPKAKPMQDLLASLVEKSLLGMESREGRARYRLLETLRDYAAEKLDAAGERELIAARHAEHYFSYAKQVKYGLIGPDQALWVGRGETELDNMRAAMALAISGGVDQIIAVKLAVALQGFWILRGYVSEGRAAARALLSLSAVRDADLAHANALYVAAALATAQSDHGDARKLLEDCLLLRRKIDEPMGTAATLSTLALAQLQAGDAAAAIESETEALLYFQQVGSREGVAISHLHLGQAEAFLADDERARAHLRQGLAEAREIGQREIEAECGLVLGVMAYEAGDMDSAREWLAASLANCEQTGNSRGVASATWRLAQVDLHSEAAASATGRLAAALPAFQAADMQEELLGCLEDVACLMGQGTLQAVAEVAAPLAGYLDPARQRRGLKRSARADERWREQLQILKLRLADDEFQAAIARGRDWTGADALRAARAALESTAANRRSAGEP